MNRLHVLVRGRASRTKKSTVGVLATRVRRAMQAAGLDGAELSLSLSDNDELHRLNLEWAGEDHATDVLSFSLEESGHAPLISGLRPLGDEIISVEYAAKQAAARGARLPAELFHLAVHGLVHLLGYDHRDAAEEKTMFGYEAQLRTSALAAGPPRRVSAPRRGTKTRALRGFQSVRR